MSSGSYRWRWGIGIVVAVAGLALFAATELVPTSGPDLASAVWGAEVDGELRLVFLTRREISRISRFPTRSLPGGRSDDVVQYHAVVARARDGERLAEVRVHEPIASHDGAGLVGIAGGLVWLFTDALEGRDLDGLSRRVDADDLRDANPSAAAVISDESKFYSVEPGLGLVVVGGTDGVRREFCPPDLAFLLPGAVPDSRDGSTREPQQASNLELVREGWLGGRRHVLASDFEVEAERVKREGGVRDLSPAFGSLSNDEPRRLRRGEEGAGPSALTPMSAHVFISGGLLARPGRAGDTRKGEAWSLESPPSFLVLSRPSLAAGAPLALSRLASDGHPVWSTDSTLAEVRHALASPSHLVLVGTAPPEPGSNRGGRRVVAIDLATGGAATAWSDAP